MVVVITKHLTGTLCCSATSIYLGECSTDYKYVVTITGIVNNYTCNCDYNN